jgi:hypothetical protein
MKQMFNVDMQRVCIESVALARESVYAGVRWDGSSGSPLHADQ